MAKQNDGAGQGRRTFLRMLVGGGLALGVGQYVTNLPYKRFDLEAEVNGLDHRSGKKLYSEDERSYIELLHSNIEDWLSYGVNAHRHPDHFIKREAGDASSLVKYVLWPQKGETYNVLAYAMIRIMSCQYRQQELPFLKYWDKKFQKEWEEERHANLHISKEERGDLLKAFLERTTLNPNYILFTDEEHPEGQTIAQLVRSGFSMNTSNGRKTVIEADAKLADELDDLLKRTADEGSSKSKALREERRKYLYLVDYRRLAGRHVQHVPGGHGT